MHLAGVDLRSQKQACETQDPSHHQGLHFLDSWILQGPPILVCKCTLEPP